MVYGKRRYSRARRARKLTTARIYANRSARSQSRQIARINRRLNYVAKITRPEVRIMWINWGHTFTNSTLAANYSGDWMSPWRSSYTGDDEVTTVVPAGNFCRCKGVSLKLIAQYSDNWRDDIADAAHDTSAGYRVVIIQEKVATALGQQQYVPVVTDVFNVANSISSNDENLTAPLVQGITGTYKILYSKVFTISRYHPTRQHNIRIPASKCLNFVKDVNVSGSSAIGKGRVWFLVLTGGLHHDIDYTAQINITGTLKIAYTDN